MLFIWHFIIGYLSIVIEGENSEKILNCAAANGINIWDLYYKNGSIFGKISSKNFLKLFTVTHHIKCKIKIIKKYGLWFRIKKYKYRIGHTAGVLVFLFIISFFSRFVWIINVEGNERIPASEVISSCENIGIYAGMAKSKIKNKYDAQRLQLNQNNIAWCSLNVEGCVLTVNISESAISDEPKRQNPSNLKSIIDGKIKKIDIASGNALVKVGDVVSKGDLLVSGIVTNMSSTFFVYSSGEVIAETKRVFSAQGNFNQIIDRKTGEHISRKTMNVFNLTIPMYLGNVKNDYNYQKNVEEVKLFGKKIPIKIMTEKYFFTKKEKVKYSPQELEKMLYSDIKKQVDNYNFISATEAGREIIQTEKGILLKIIYECEENIAKQDEILLSKEN